MAKRRTDTHAGAEQRSPDNPRIILDRIEPATKANLDKYVEGQRRAFLAWGRTKSAYHALMAVSLCAMAAIEDRDEASGAAGATPAEPIDDPAAMVRVPLWAAQALLIATQRMRGNEADEAGRPVGRMTVAEAFGLAGQSRGQAGVLGDLDREHRDWLLAVQVADMEARSQRASGSPETSRAVAEVAAMMAGAEAGQEAAERMVWRAWERFNTLARKTVGAP